MGVDPWRTPLHILTADAQTPILMCGGRSWTAYESTVGLFTPRAIALWDQKLDAGHRLAAIAGSDDHRAGQGHRRATCTRTTPPSPAEAAATAALVAALAGASCSR